ncbi:MAG: SRPBCC family protein [Pseudomonadota bacterium]
MKYELNVKIDRPREAVVAIFLDPEKLRDWQPEVTRRDHVAGPLPVGLGTQYSQSVKMGRREMEMTDTVSIFDPPGHFAAVYEAAGVWNQVENWFEEEGSRTHWRLTSEFQCKGMMMRLMIRFFPGMFRKQTQQFMDRFKAFAEAQIPVG